MIMGALPHRARAAYCAIVAGHNPTGEYRQMNTLVLQHDFVDLFAEPSDAAARVEARVNDNDADIARSEDNILRWMSYLPEDCVRSMIQMGWDLTT